MLKKNFLWALVVVPLFLLSWVVINSVITEPVPLPTDHSITEAQMLHLQSNRINFMSDGTLINTLESESFNIEQVERLVNQDDSYRLVIAYGAHDNGKQCAILYTVDEDNNRLQMILEVAHPCPPWCDFTDEVVSR